LTSHYQPFGCCEALRLWKSASFGYFSLHKQRTSDSRPKGVKAFDVDVAFSENQKQEQRSKLRSTSSLTPARTSMDPRFTSLRLWKSASRE
jgi:hypothetical protein